MDAAETWRDRLRRLTVWKRGGERAVHKPLLLLLLLARAERGEEADLLFSEVEEPLATLLLEFGPPRRAVHPEYPFWHLQSDGVWVVRDAALMPPKLGGASPTKRTLVERNATGHVPGALWEVLRKDGPLRRELAECLLDAFWAPSLHAALLDAVGLDLQVTAGARLHRDPAFRQTVLMAYGRRCSVCGYDGRLGREDLALEAAHIRWHCYGGPDTVTNGLLLCSFHHVAFDRGAWGLDSRLQVVVSKHLCGGDATEAWLGRFNGQSLQLPRDSSDHPAPEHVEWHVGEVFRSPARQFVN